MFVRKIVMKMLDVLLIITLVLGHFVQNGIYRFSHMLQQLSLMFDFPGSGNISCTTVHSVFTTGCRIDNTKCRHHQCPNTYRWPRGYRLKHFNTLETFLMLLCVLLISLPQKLMGQKTKFMQHEILFTSMSLSPVRYSCVRKQ